MKFLKSDLVHNLMVILVVFIVFIPFVLVLNGSEKTLAIVLEAAMILYIVFIMYNAYRDIVKKQYSTYMFLVLIALIRIGALVVMCYFLFYNLIEADKRIMLRWSNISGGLLLFLCCLSMIESFLKSGRFKNKM